MSQIDINQNVTGVVVSFNTAELLKVAVESVLKHHPGMPIAVVDGSTLDNPCLHYCHELARLNPNVSLKQFDRNIGHGRGMDWALVNMVKTPYALLFDSDIELTGDPLGKMLDMMDGQTYMVGGAMMVDDKGHLSKAGTLRYIHPCFALLNVKQYRDGPPFIHHGSPLLAAMLHLKQQGRSEQVLKDFPIYDYVVHGRRGTRNINPPDFLKNWESPAAVIEASKKV